MAKLEYLGEHGGEGLRLPLFLSRVPAGFPGPADDYSKEGGLDLNDLIRHPAATFYCRASGDSMRGVGIFDGDLLVVDRAEEPADGSVVVANLDGELTCKILDRAGRRLLSANPAHAPIPVGEGSEMKVEGVVLHSIRSHAPGAAKG